jgi:hypothetical protein
MHRAFSALPSWVKFLPSKHFHSGVMCASKFDCFRGRKRFFSEGDGGKVKGDRERFTSMSNGHWASTLCYQTVVLLQHQIFLRVIFFLTKWFKQASCLYIVNSTLQSVSLLWDWSTTFLQQNQLTQLSSIFNTASDAAIAFSSNRGRTHLVAIPNNYAYQLPSLSVDSAVFWHIILLLMDHEQNFFYFGHFIYPLFSLLKFYKFVCCGN